jgi:hypothetical protein
MLGLIPFYGFPFAIATLLTGLIKARKQKNRAALGLIVFGFLGTLVSGYLILFVPYDGANPARIRVLIRTLVQYSRK